jgi:beta-barrel assembly-enhancing protease
MRSLFITLFLYSTLSFNQGIKNFDRLTCHGEIPADFTSLATQIFEKDYELNEDEELDKDFFLNTRFYNDELLQSGKIVFNDPLSAYIKDVASYLLKDDPELFNQLRFYVIRSNAVNAFSTDQGIVLFTTGLLANIENEAQLAFILGHEISHFTEKHVRKSYVEYKDFERSKGKYRRLSYYDAINRLSRYDKLQELDADSKGVDIYLQSDYDPLEIENAFLVLHYGYLPFEDYIFDQKFLETKNLKIPDHLFPDSIRAINMDLDYNDEGSTHPNIEKRINNAISYYANADQVGKEKFVVINESDFEALRLIARLESINMDLSDRFYADALYKVFILSKDFPDDRFLDLSKVKALYGLAKYKNRNRFEEATSRLVEVEGESYTLHYFLRILNRSQLNIIVYRHLYDMFMKYPNDIEFKAYYEDFRNEFALNSMINFDQLMPISMDDAISSSMDTLKFNIEDSIKKIESSSLSKIEKAELKKDLFELRSNQKSINPANNFHLYALHDLVSNEGFTEKIKSLQKELLEAKRKEDALKISEEIILNKRGYQLGINELMVIDPIYEDYTLNKGVDFLQSEKRKIRISDIYTKKFRRLDMNVQVLDSKSLNAQDVQRYNEIALIKDWMSEILDHDGINMISSSHFRMNEICDKYNTSNFLFSGIYSFKDRKEINKWHWVSLGTVYLAPIAVIDLLTIHNYFEMVSFEIDAKTDKLEMLDIQVVNLKSYDKIIRSYIYNILYQLNAGE